MTTIQGGSAPRVGWETGGSSGRTRASSRSRARFARILRSQTAYRPAFGRKMMAVRRGELGHDAHARTPRFRSADAAPEGRPAARKARLPTATLSLHCATRRCSAAARAAWLGGAQRCFRHENGPNTPPYAADGNLLSSTSAELRRPTRYAPFRLDDVEGWPAQTKGLDGDRSTAGLRVLSEGHRRGAGGAPRARFARPLTRVSAPGGRRPACAAAPRCLPRAAGPRHPLTPAPSSRARPSTRHTLRCATGNCLRAPA